MKHRKEIRDAVVIILLCLSLILLVNFCAHGESTAGNRAATVINVEKLADAIYRAEGGAKARVPYGILSIPVRDEAHARRICINTIRNNIKRWEKAGRPGEYIHFLADRYCPKAHDPKGNANWKRSVTAIYNSK